VWCARMQFFYEERDELGRHKQCQHSGTFAQLTLSGQLRWYRACIRHLSGKFDDDAACPSRRARHCMVCDKLYDAAEFEDHDKDRYTWHLLTE
jgi:hypothetical protein